MAGLRLHATTILGIVKDGQAVIASDGQVTLGTTILKHQAQKVRKLYKGQVLAGFAGAAADSLALFERMERKLEEARGQLPRAVVELAKDWRSDRVLRRLEAVLAVLDREHAFIVSGSGDVIEPEDRIVAIGSGGPYAYAAAKALLRFSDLPLTQVVQEALGIAAEIDIYTNHHITLLVL